MTKFSQATIDEVRQYWNRRPCNIRHSPQPVDTRAYWRTAELAAQRSEVQTECPVTYTYSRRQARRLVESRGFRVTDLFVDHISPYPIADYVQYRYVEAWPWSWLLKTAFRGLEKRFGWHLYLTAEAG